MNRTRAGLGYGLGAYLIWGVFPLYFGLIAMVGPFEVVPWRVGATLVFCVILVSLTRRWSQVTAILRSPRLLGWFALSSLLLYANWQLFVVGVMTGHVLETSLGYFINPLFTILIGVVVRKESLTRLQWWAVGIAAVGVTTAAIAYGVFPWIALGIAASFGLYGAVHKHAGEQVDGITGLTVETFASLPIAAVQLLIVASTTGITAFSFGPGIAALVLLSGIMTAVPLILFGEGTRRLPLSYMGFLQFLTPILGFLYGYFVMHEEMPVSRWIGFVAVWIALVILIVDMLGQIRRSPTAQTNTGPIPLD
ncbi:EamA family transporter RarD [Leucobacter tenebrionis]|uniref:EamA family transporter RarD n=1 Tax=Leucobacter tenebrionis TaxID=2873270 RepID=UPI001CA7068C|nr:EamA family transporter RarD [Leucobacter tenebrionis]QZY52750.1 EamA family transporter RarD [Leucobacter tenebrionis]